MIFDSNGMVVHRECSARLEKLSKEARQFAKAAVRQWGATRTELRALEAAAMRSVCYEFCIVRENERIVNLAKQAEDD